MKRSAPEVHTSLTDSESLAYDQGIRSTRSGDIG